MRLIDMSGDLHSDYPLNCWIMISNDDVWESFYCYISDQREPLHLKRCKT